MSIIWWVRRDPRLHDNTALHAAQQESQGAVIPVFVLDDAILTAATTAPARVHFLMESLRELDRELQKRGSRLIIRRGKPIDVLPALAAEADAQAIFFNRDYEPYARIRDTAVQAAFQAQGREARAFADHLLAEPETITSASGSPATVYTPYRRRWVARLEQDRSLIMRQGAATNVVLQSVGNIPGLPIPTAAQLGFAVHQEVLTPGADAARTLLEQWTARQSNGLIDYHHQRNKLGADGTSRISAHLRLGTLAARTAVRVALHARDRSDDPDEQKAIDTWLGEIAWRDFYTSIMYHYPTVLERPFKELFVDFPYRDAPGDVAAWKEGRTGYPVVDAAMRQLNREAFMHNRARLVTASFLTKHLLVDYRVGELFFMQQLGCGEMAVNNGNWQWVAGCSNDPQPYFRIFNPITQSETYDPDGTYIRRYLPELATVPTAFIHAPWTMPPDVASAAGVTIGRDYPAPIVDHKMARARALAAFQTQRDRFFSASSSNQTSDAEERSAETG
ncbi:MAG: deoxyribodipyrimidine photo-lyase [Herpetosiphon sp.]